ncbi:MAG: hypothetical protein WC002_00555 [Candidatus Muiribacteriota bacterium]
MIITMDINNIPPPTKLTGTEEKKPVMNLQGSNIVSEFFSETVSYFDLDGTEIDEVYGKLNIEKHMANLSIGLPGIEHIEKNKKYIKIEHCSLTPNKIIKFEQGGEKEENYRKLVKCKFYIFENFCAAMGDSKAIKNTALFLSEILTIEIMPLIPTELAMINLLNRFSTIESVTCDRIRHSNIKKMTVSGKATDIVDFDIKFPAYDVASIHGKLNTGIDERRIKITKTGKISFYKHKDNPIYTEHIEFGFNLLAGE